MPKCFLTGIEIELQESWLLDRSAGKRAIRRLRERLAAIERLVSQLNAQDEVSVFDRRTGSDKVRQERRLICPSVAAALSASHPEFPLLISWKEFSARRPPVFPKLRSMTPQPPGKAPRKKSGPAAQGDGIPAETPAATPDATGSKNEDCDAAGVE